MDISNLMKSLASFEGVTEVLKFRENVVRLTLNSEVSKPFFLEVKQNYGFEHCSLITAVDNQSDFELVYHFSSINGSVNVPSSNLSVMLEVHIHLDRDSPKIDSISFDLEIYHYCTC